MFDYLQFEENQKVDLNDYQRLANLPRDSFDRYTLDILGKGAWYSGFQCTDKLTGQLGVSNGEAYFNGVGYYNDTVGGEVLNLLENAPPVSFRWIAIVVRGQEFDEDVEPTSILLNSTSRATTGKYKPRLKSRKALLDQVLGNISADPQMPLASQIPAGNVIIAFVKVSPSAIVSIVPNLLTKMPTLAEARSRLDQNDIWRANTGSAIDALSTNIAAIQGRLAGLPQANFVYELAKDVARLKEKAKIPQIFTSYGADHYLDQSYSDVRNVDYLAQIEEGIRFPPAAQSDSQIGLQNVYDGGVTVIANMMFPKFGTVIGMSNTDHDDTVICTQYDYQTLNIQQLMMTRAVMRVGPYYEVCTNWLWYWSGYQSVDPANNIFRFNDGDLYQVDPVDAGVVAGLNSVTVNTTLHQTIRIRHVWYDTEQDPYSLINSVPQQVAGAQHGNTFLCPREGWLPAINLYFADKAASGDLKVLLMQVPSNGIPDYGQVIATATVPVSDIKISTPAARVPTPVNFAPLVAMKKGARYAFAVVTAGAHTMWRSDGNKLGNGSYFVNTDGAWSQQDLTKDLCFDLVFAQFNTPQVAVQLNQLALSGGICTIELLAQLYAPAGTNIAFQIQVGGVWINCDDLGSDTSPLLGLPALLPFRVVFTGTTDMMPGLGIASNSRVTCSRPRSDFRHLSDIKTLPPGTTCNTVKLETRLEGWRGAPYHSHVPKIRYGAGYQTQKAASVINDIPAPDNPTGAIIRTAVFSFSSPISTFQIEQDGTTNNVVTTFHVAEGDWTALTQ